MQYDVFISYSSYDKTTADAICSKLENSHIRCWIAPRDILPGKEYGEAIIEAIVDCRILLLVFSVHANESPQVRREVERAVSKGKVIIPFRIEDILPTRSMEYALSNTHWLDAMTPPLESHIAKLTDTIFKLNVLSITPLHNKVIPGEATSVSGTDSLSNNTGLNAINGKIRDSKKQTSWFMKITGGPGLRSGFGMTYDNGKEAIILHGGFGRGTEDNRAIASMFLRSPELSDTWIWDGSSWMQLKNNPLTLLNHDLAYCKRINQNIIFGGWNGSQRLDKTYLMNDESWALADSNNGSGPEARESHSMVYDEKRKEIILFGGLTMKIEFGQFTKANTIALGDTWAWNGSVWTKLHVNGPEPRWGHRMVYDESRGAIVLSGGYDGSKYFNDTWLWDGSSASWSRITAGNFPLPRGYQGMTYDTFSEKVLLFGGLTANDVVLNDLWEWDGNDWNLINEHTQPKPRYKHGFVYDSKRNKTILFGGYDGKEYFQDTWEFSY